MKSHLQARQWALNPAALVSGGLEPQQLALSPAAGSQTKYREGLAIRLVVDISGVDLTSG